MKYFAALVTGALLVAQPVMAQMGAPGEQPASMPAVAGPLAAKYKADADKILAAAMADDDGYAALTYLCDHIGKRVSGSPQLNTAVEWGAELMRNAGLENVKVQPVMVPRWVRGSESGAMMTSAPGAVNRLLHMLGLGMSVGTPAGGITAPVVFVPSFSADCGVQPRVAWVWRELAVPYGGAKQGGGEGRGGGAGAVGDGAGDADSAHGDAAV